MFPINKEIEIFELNKEEFSDLYRISLLPNEDFFDIRNDQYALFKKNILATYSIHTLMEVKEYLEDHLSSLLKAPGTSAEDKDNWERLTSKYLALVKKQEDDIVSLLRRSGYKELLTIHGKLFAAVPLTEGKKIMVTLEALYRRMIDTTTAEEIFNLIVEAETTYLN